MTSPTPTPADWMNKWAEWSKRSKAQGKFDWFTNDLFLCFIKDANAAAWPAGSEVDQGLEYWFGTVILVLDGRSVNHSEISSVVFGPPLRCEPCGRAFNRGERKTHCGTVPVHKARFVQTLQKLQAQRKSALETFYETTWGTQS